MKKKMKYPNESFFKELVDSGFNESNIKTVKEMFKDAVKNKLTEEEFIDVLNQMIAIKLIMQSINAA